MTPDPRPLEARTPVESVDNVVCFVADSTRHDAVPDRVLERGAAAPAIAPSTFTAPSFPSLFTGLYPADHGVWDFDSRVGRRTPLFDGPEAVGFRADTIWTHLDPAEKPPRQMLGIESTATLSELESPFVYVEHHKGGHLPYGYTFDECESTAEFFDARLESLDDVPALYQRSVDRACDRFLDVVSELETRGLLDDTLAIFTSDHGEVLGEIPYGRPYGHEQPLVPELVRVPFVVGGAGLPEGDSLPVPISGIDVVPTALGALGRPVPRTLPGVDLWNDVPADDRLVRSDILRTKVLERFGRSHTFTKYAATSLWDGGGGRVYYRCPRSERVGYALYLQLYATHEARWVRSKMGPRSMLGLLRTYWPDTLEFGSPTFTAADAERALPDEFNSEPEATTDRRIPRAQLERLGYLE